MVKSNRVVIGSGFLKKKKTKQIHTRHTQSHNHTNTHNRNHRFIHNTHTQTQGCCCAQNISTDHDQSHPMANNKLPTESTPQKVFDPLWIRLCAHCCLVLLRVRWSAIAATCCAPTAACYAPDRFPICCYSSVRHPVCCCASVATDLQPSATDLQPSATDLHFTAPRLDSICILLLQDPNCILLLQDPNSTRFFNPIRTHIGSGRVGLWVRVVFGSMFAQSEQPETRSGWSEPDPNPILSTPTINLFLWTWRLSCSWFRERKERIKGSAVALNEKEEEADVS